jgi:hypothetical protein
MKHVEMLGSPGLVRDLPEQHLVENAVTDAKNVRFNRYGVETMTGDRSIFSPASINPLWIQPFPPITAPIWVYANLAKVYAVEGTTHTEITNVGGDFSGSAQERWNSCVLAGFGFFNNTVDVPQSWANFSTSNDLEDLSNWTSTRRCKALRSFKNFLIALNMTDSGINRPYRILWSSPAAPGTVPPSWDSSDPAQEANEIDLSQTPDHLVDCLPLADINVVYKETSTWGMAFIGPPYYFRFWEILAHRGILHRDCAASFPRGHCVATQDDIIIHSGQLEGSQSIIDKKIRRWLFQSIDETNFRNCFMFTYPARNEVWFCFPESGNTYATLAIIWDYTTNSIGVRELVETPFISLGPVGESFVTDLIWDPVV